MKIKKDKFWAVRGGSCKILSIACSTCGTEAFTYQKDGIGGLHRCYANRIVSPAKIIEEIARQTNDGKTSAIMCKQCQETLATPHIHSDGRLAFNLIIGKYSKKVVK